MSQDPFEEFEFRPLTEGLGFHKKSNPLADGHITHTASKSTTTTMLQKSNSVATSGVGAGGAAAAAGTGGLGSSRSSSSSSSTSTSTLLTQKQGFAGDLPSIERPGYARRPEKKLTTPIANLPAVTPLTPPPTPSVDDVLETLKAKRNLEFIEKNEPTPSAVWIDTAPDLSAITLDAMLILAGVLATLISALSVTKIDFLGWTASLSLTELIAIGYAYVVSITLIYTLVTRMLLGFTAGEWVSDQRIVDIEKRGLKGALGIIARNLLNALTLFVMLPIISSITGEDIAGQMTQTSLKKERL